MARQYRPKCVLGRRERFQGSVRAGLQCAQSTAIARNQIID